MQKHLGRLLGPREFVHHLNSNHSDNRLANLVVVTPSEHRRLHPRTMRRDPNIPSGTQVPNFPLWIRRLRLADEGHSLQEIASREEVSCAAIQKSLKRAMSARAKGWI